MAISKELQSGRDAVDKYRADHNTLYVGKLTSAASPNHEAVLQVLLKALNELGYKSLDDFYLDSNNQNAQEMGYKDWADLNETAFKEDVELFKEKWK